MQQFIGKVLIFNISGFCVSICGIDHPQVKWSVESMAASIMSHDYKVNIYTYMYTSIYIYVKYS